MISYKDSWGVGNTFCGVPVAIIIGHLRLGAVDVYWDGGIRPVFWRDSPIPVVTRSASAASASPRAE